MAAKPKPLILKDAVTDGGKPEPVSISGLGAAAKAAKATFVVVDDTPADATAVATDLLAVRAALIAAGLMAAS